MKKERKKKKARKDCAELLEPVGLSTDLDHSDSGNPLSKPFFKKGDFLICDDNYRETSKPDGTSGITRGSYKKGREKYVP